MILHRKSLSSWMKKNACWLKNAFFITKFIILATIYDIFIIKFIYEDWQVLIFKFIYLFIYLDQRTRMTKKKTTILFLLITKEPWQKNYFFLEKYRYFNSLSNATYPIQIHRAFLEKLRFEKKVLKNFNLKYLWNLWNQPKSTSTRNFEAIKSILLP